MTNKPIKVFFGEKRLKDIYPHATQWQVFKFKVRRFCRRVMIVLGIISVLGITAVTARELSPVMAYQIKEVPVEVESEAPVMTRIAVCESGNKQMINGQVILNANTNGSVDIGAYQINNRLWGKKATELGYNLMVEKDNRAFANYLYKNYGTGAWKWSSKCWQ